MIVIRPPRNVTIGHYHHLVPLEEPDLVGRFISHHLLMLVIIVPSHGMTPTLHSPYPFQLDIRERGSLHAISLMISGTKGTGLIGLWT